MDQYVKYGFFVKVAQRCATHFPTEYRYNSTWVRRTAWYALSEAVVKYTRPIVRGSIQPGTQPCTPAMVCGYTAVAVYMEFWYEFHTGWQRCCDPGFP